MRSILTSVLLLAGALPAQIAGWTCLGGGCPANNVAGLDYLGNPPPGPGGWFLLHCSPVPPGDLVWLYAGAATRIDVSAIVGMPCWVMIDGGIGLVANASAVPPGSATLMCPVPNIAALSGVEVALQAMIFDAGAPAGVDVSEGWAAILQ